MPRHPKRALRCENLERRWLMAADFGQAYEPLDVNVDGNVTARDALTVINQINSQADARLAAIVSEPIGNLFGSGEPITGEILRQRSDVNSDGLVNAVDALQIINHLNATASLPAMSGMGASIFDAPKNLAAGVDSEFQATISNKDTTSLLTGEDALALLERASAATPSQDGIIAVVDRSGRILGVRVEEGVSENLKNDPAKLAFAIDGAVAKARTAAFFSSNSAPLTSRTIRFISQSTITQREVESSPRNPDPNYRGPGFVAPIGAGGHFPPEIPFTPQVDLFAIEHQSRDSQTHPGPDGIKDNVFDDGINTAADNFELHSRFNVDPAFVPSVADQFFQTWPESYGEQAGTDHFATPRGIATLPGGIPLYKVTGAASPVSEQVNLVGGIGVFYPGDDGYATFEQGFRHGVGQTEAARTNADKVLEAEYAALVASGSSIVAGMSAFSRDISDIHARLPAFPDGSDFKILSGRIDLVGITLEIYGPTPNRTHRVPGIDRLLQFGRGLGAGSASGENQVVGKDMMGNDVDRLDGRPVPEGWLVAPHDSPNDPGLTAEVVQQIIETGIAEANRTRAAIRLDIDNGFRPGATTRMVLAVADTHGEVVGLFRMLDATIFSIDVAVAKARNTAYYADPEALQPADRVDFNRDGMFEPISSSLTDPSGDSLPLGTALSNRSFRFLAEPRFPTGTQPSSVLAEGCDAAPQACLEIGPHSMLRLPGINPLTAENLIDKAPRSFEEYASPDHSSTVAFAAFNVMRNFRDEGDEGVMVRGTAVEQKLANQNGVVFFPGSSPLYVGTPPRLVGGFGVSGDGVDQDDVVTSAGQSGFAPPASIRVDAFTIGGVRVPFQKFNRNPFTN